MGCREVERERGDERRDWRGGRDVEIGGRGVGSGLQGPGCLRRGRKDDREAGNLPLSLSLSLSVSTSLALRWLETAGGGESPLQAE